jgi:hypothetical protein
MIDRSQMFPILIEAFPAFGQRWNAFQAEWSGHPDGLPLYLLIGDLVRDCSALLRDGHEAEVAAVCAVAERWMLEGDDYVRIAAVVGFIEDLQNGNLHSGTRPADFLRFLGPESLRRWEAMNGFWQMVSRDRT